MKYHLFAFALLLTVLLSFQCKKPKSDNPTDQLPPETQTGAGTFGCLVNGEVFKPKGDLFSGQIKGCAYQYINGGYYFQLYANRDESTPEQPVSKGVSIGSDSVTIQQGKVYKLGTLKKGGIGGQYSIIAFTTITNFKTSDSLQGELHITRLDEAKQIVSGTFWFDAVNSNGEKVEVREGRFDMNYTP